MYVCMYVCHSYTHGMCTIICTQAKLKELTRELAESRKDCSRKVVAIDVANEQAQLYQQKLEKEVKAWKEKAEKMKSTFSLIIEENKTLKQAVRFN